MSKIIVSGDVRGTDRLLMSLSAHMELVINIDIFRSLLRNEHLSETIIEHNNREMLNHGEGHKAAAASRSFEPGDDKRPSGKRN